MKNKKITIIDYGMGNIYSVASALKYLGYEVTISNDPKVVTTSSRLLLPGVGSFRKAMESLKLLRLDLAILESAKNQDVHILGICLGMQLLGQVSSEDGTTYGLNLIPSTVDKLSIQEVGSKKIPHIGFNQVSHNSDSKIFKNIPTNSDFYFVHSFRMLPLNLKGYLATCNYGINFLAAYEYKNIFATQFHPEKSQSNGLLLLENFMSI